MLWTDQRLNPAEGQSARAVTAVFSDRSARLFALPEKTTLADLAAQFSRRDDDHPLYVRVTFRRSHMAKGAAIEGFLFDSTSLGAIR